ncbi:MAG: LuxR C-terminal-related transcriptional regulator [Planctomycetota bacterium]
MSHISNNRAPIIDHEPKPQAAAATNDRDAQPNQPSKPASSLPERVLRQCPAVLSAMLQDPAMVHWLLARDLEIRFACDRAAAMLGQATTEQLLGRNVRDLTLPAVGDRFDQVFTQLDEDPTPIVGYAFWNGHRVRSVYIPILDAERRTTEILGISRPAPLAIPATESLRVEHAPYADLGSLSVLTPRELEVLAFMGQGLSRKDIAAALHRSEATIKRFRENIAAKLGVGDRTHLAAIARDAGLAPEHAQLTRVTKNVPEANATH